MLIYRVLSVVLYLLVATVFDITPAYATDKVSATDAYPNLTKLFERMSDRQPTVPPAGLRPFLEDSVAVVLEQQDLVAFLEATAADSITLLHATALFARWVRHRGLPVYAPGEVVKNAVSKGFSLGLMFPVDHLDYFFYVPDDSIGGDFQTHIRVIYNRRYTYPFDKEIFNADVLVQGEEIVYTLEGKSRKGFLVTTHVHYGANRFAYSNVHGIAGQKRGALGFLQKVFFFIPKTLHGISLDENDLLIDAFVNQRIPDFETEPRFRVKREQGL
tara:strand:- start:302 stop:1120 length:819 start_codon:yes stop_codon:yes gene_type:complete